jgi:RNA polymerase sigma factor (sigma-70 family)
VLRYLEALYGAGTLVGLTDQQLLERFREANRAENRQAAEAAFDALIERHGPMVWHVCRSLVANAHDAEDAYQATLLILVRKVNSVRREAALGPWLHRVAQRVALSTRSAAARRRAVERSAAERWQENADATGPRAEPERSELNALIHSEISKLPGSFRAVVVLCDLEGVRYLEAAQRLNLPLGTVQSRLARARRRLRRSLARRGLSPQPSPEPRGSHGSILAVAATQGVPSALARRTCQLAVLVASDPVCVRAVVSDSVQTLFEGGLRRMSLSKWGGVIVTGMSGLFISAAMMHAYAGSGQPAQDQPSGKAASSSEPAEKQTPKPQTTEPPAPRKLNATAGRGGALIYALDKDRNRIPVQPDAPDGPAQEVVRNLQWVVVSGVVDHRQVQEWFRKNGHITPPGASDAYRRADLQRQALQKDGTWSPWESIDLTAKWEILDHLPELDEERVPERIRVDDLNDPLPFLKKGAWKGVDVDDLIPFAERHQPEQRVAPAGQERQPDGIARKKRRGPAGGMMGGMMGGGMGGMSGMAGMMMGGMKGMGMGMGGMGGMGMGGMGATPGMRGGMMMGGPIVGMRQRDSEPPVLMLRQFDFAVESGRTYRYRARTVLDDSRRRADAPGVWSESTEPVAVP